MLKYLEQLTADLMIPAIVIGMLYAFIKFKLGKPCRIIYLACGGFSVAASVFVAIQKNTRTNASTQTVLTNVFVQYGHGLGDKLTKEWGNTGEGMYVVIK